MIVNGVTVVISGVDDDYIGMSIAWCTFVEKNHVVISLPKSASGTKRLLADEMFTLSALSDDQTEVARKYGGSNQKYRLGSEEKYLVSTQWGVPVVANCYAVMLCKIYHVLEVNEQVIVTAEVTDRNVNDERNLLIFEKSDFF